MDKAIKLENLEIALRGYANTIMVLAKAAGLDSVHLGVITENEDGESYADAVGWRGGEKVIDYREFKEV